MPQTQNGKKPLGKGLVIGIVLLFLSLIFFSFAGIIAISNMNQSNDLVKMFIAVGAVLVAPALLIIYIDSRSGIFISPHIGTPKQNIKRLIIIPNSLRKSKVDLPYSAQEVE